MKSVFNTKCSWIKQYPEVKNVDEEVKELILTDYACFKTKCGKLFYGYLRDDGDDFSDSFGETFVHWNCDKDVDYWKECKKPEHPINVLGAKISSIEESDKLDSWFILTILSDSVNNPE